ncbi:MAG TPA: OsmC family protein [Pseudonocardia sp.]|jgi:putative redox protein|uniref:OsmC family protein n=1 Tax=Pseudonocardia sp. TaxID=60912 RepID=UPI002EDA8CCF
MAVSERAVQARLTGGLRAVIQAGDFELVADEPESIGGTNTGPRPTELLLASIASCFTLSLAYSARKRDLELADVEVDVVGRLDGPQFVSFRIEVRASSPTGDELAKLAESAKRVCYVTRTLAVEPEIEVVTG